MWGVHFSPPHPGIKRLVDMRSTHAGLGVSEEPLLNLCIPEQRPGPSQTLPRSPGYGRHSIQNGGRRGCEIQSPQRRKVPRCELKDQPHRGHSPARCGVKKQKSSWSLGGNAEGFRTRVRKDLQHWPGLSKSKVQKQQLWKWAGCSKESHMLAPDKPGTAEQDPHGSWQQVYSSQVPMPWPWPQVTSLLAPRCHWGKWKEILPDTLYWKQLSFEMNSV